MGKKHQPIYRVVVTPKENPVMGSYIDLLGTYNPLKGEVNIDTAKATEWLNKGAKPSERLARLLDKAGVKHKSIVVKLYQPKPKEEAKASTPTMQAEPAEATENAEPASDTITEPSETPAEEPTTEAADTPVEEAKADAEPAE